ncbi:MAG: hypothetical protein N4A46_00370 [Schleiferiaceae bacterium]|nr:hypothetical protein [Schleiferiaceae bacterium]
MKLSVTLLVGVLATSLVRANMSNPVNPGTLGSRPFVSDYAQVNHEDIYVKFNEDFSQANFRVVYQITTFKAGDQIPFLFYASDLESGFTVKVDGIPLDTIHYPYVQKRNESTFVDFQDLYGKHELLNLHESTHSELSIRLSDMIYFITDLSEGEHTIAVEYNARCWTNRSNWINEYSFRYALSPAKYWKSFGTLNLFVDANAFDGTYQTNFGEPVVGEKDKVKYWQFEGIPVDVLLFEYSPVPSRVAQFLLMMKPEGIASFIGFFLILFHLIIIYRYRKNNPNAGFSWVVLAGGIVVPALFFLSWVFAYDWIDYFIGEHASKYHGYSFLVFFLYPLAMPIYLFATWVLDKTLKRKQMKRA